MSALVAVKPGHFALKGVLDAAAVPALVDSGWQQLEVQLAQTDVSVDLSAVSEADSAALALLLCWERRARQGGGHALSWCRLPAALAALAGLCGVDRLLSGDLLPGDGGAGNDGSGSC